MKAILCMPSTCSSGFPNTRRVYLYLKWHLVFRSLKTFTIVMSRVIDSILHTIILYWDLCNAILKHTLVNFELLTDVDRMIMFIEHNIRGDLSQYFNRYAQDNNKYDRMIHRNLIVSVIVYLIVSNIFWCKQTCKVCK